MLNDSGVMVRPAAGWVHATSLHDEEPEDILTRIQQWRLHRQAQLHAFQEILGVMIGNTIMLTSPTAAMLGPALDRHGRALRWSVWAPHKKVLIDIFRRVLPAPQELEDRAAFAQANGLHYGIVEPGRRLSLASLKEWLTTSGEED